MPEYRPNVCTTKPLFSMGFLLSECRPNGVNPAHPGVMPLALSVERAIICVVENGDQPDSDGSDPSKWIPVTAIGVGVLTVVVLVLGFLSTVDRQQTPFENLLFSVILSAISVYAGWLISEWSSQAREARQKRREIREKQKEQADAERNALSSVRRIFRIMEGFGQIEQVAIQAVSKDGSTTAEKMDRTVAFNVIAQQARAHRMQANDSVKDWQFFAPEAIQDELDAIAVSQGQDLTEVTDEDE